VGFVLGETKVNCDCLRQSRGDNQLNNHIFHCPKRPLIFLKYTAAKGYKATKRKIERFPKGLAVRLTSKWSHLAACSQVGQQWIMGSSDFLEHCYANAIRLLSTDDICPKSENKLLRGIRVAETKNPILNYKPWNVKTSYKTFSVRHKTGFHLHKNRWTQLQCINLFYVCHYWRFYRQLTGLPCIGDSGWVPR